MDVGFTRLVTAGGTDISTRVLPANFDAVLCEGVAGVERVLGMIDRNPYSPTYGCCDRGYWHYRITDHPSGIFQHSVLALAVAATLNVPGNHFYGQSRLPELAVAGMHFARRSAHADGSADDYYPFERALGAVVFPLVACTEAYELLNVHDASLIEFFVRQATWLCTHDEPYPLANHQALAAYALLNVGRLSGEQRFLAAAHDRLDRVLELQADEGWYREYEGCDAGYLTLTISLLGEYYQRAPSPALLHSLERAVECAAYFMHPDGSYGGEYGSRNCNFFLMHGFEAIGAMAPLATQIVDHYLEGMRNGKQVRQNDERGMFLLTADRLQSVRDACSERHGLLEFKNVEHVYLGEARLFRARQDGYHVVVSAAKGGTFKAFKGMELIASDCGLIGKLADGRVVATQLVDDNEVHVSGNSIRITGRWHEVRLPVASPGRMLVFRIVLLSLGRSARFGKWLKRMLTRFLILRKRPLPLRFERSLCVDLEGVRVRDTIEVDDSRLRFASLHFGTDHTSIYVTASRYFQESVLCPWTSLEVGLPRLHAEGRLSVERVFRDRVLKREGNSFLQ